VIVVRVPVPAWARRRNRMLCCAAARESTVIIRVFRPTIHTGKEAEFEAFLRDVAIPLVSRQAGLVAQHVGRPRDASSTEFVYVTVWQDVESIRTFAGEHWQEAVIAPEEEHLLRETWIGHYEVLSPAE
jgi:heme-degrading monooxygenase HmoA